MPPGSLTGGLQSEGTVCEEWVEHTAFKILSSPTVLRSRQQSQAIHAGSAASVVRPSSLQQTSYLAPLPPSPGCSLCFVTSLITAECLTSPRSAGHVLLEPADHAQSRLSAANMEFSDFLEHECGLEPKVSMV